MNTQKGKCSVIVKFEPKDDIYELLTLWETFELEINPYIDDQGVLSVLITYDKIIDKEMRETLDGYNHDYDAEYE